MIEAQGWGKEVGWRVWATQKHARRVATQYLPPKFNSEFAPEKWVLGKQAFPIERPVFLYQGRAVKVGVLDMQMILRGSGYLGYLVG